MLALVAAVYLVCPRIPCRPAGLICTDLPHLQWQIAYHEPFDCVENVSEIGYRLIAVCDFVLVIAGNFSRSVLWLVEGGRQPTREVVVESRLYHLAVP